MPESGYVIEQRCCFHCGDQISDDAYVLDDHYFCCLGCQTVYQVLGDNNLHHYYRYNQHPGMSQLGDVADLTYLDEPNIVAKLVDYQDNEITKVTFYIPAIHCSSCVWLLEHIYKLANAVRVVRVDFMKKQADITFQHATLTLRELVELLRKIGYEPKVTLQDVVKEGKKVNQRRLLAKLTVAGFCFGNSMMISFPEYFGMNEFEQVYSRFFAYMNLGFALPVLLYSASDYFTSAWRSLRQRRLNLDVPLALGIFVLFLRSAVEILTHTGSGFVDTLCSLVFFILIGKWVQERTYYHISFERDYRSYFPVAVTALVEDKEFPVQISELKVGQRILVRNNEIVPADAILLKGNAVLDFSFVTGESNAVDKGMGEIVYAGGRQMGEAIELEVVKAVSQSYLTKLWNHDGLQGKEKKFDAFVDFVSQYFTVALVSVAVIACVFWFIHGDAERAWGALSAVLIIACPCALALSSPFTLSAALSILDKNKLYLKNTAIVERMAEIDCVVFDKTGTISSPHASLVVFDGQLTMHDRVLLASVCRNSSHPLSRQILIWLGDVDKSPVDVFRELAGKGMEAVLGTVVVKVGSAAFLGLPKSSTDGSVVYVMIDGVCKGCFNFEQSWRKGLPELLADFDKKGYDLHLISGDNERRLDALKLIFPSNACLLFNQGPSDKLEQIGLWQDQGKQVAMLGDGLNDAGALRKADIGIAVSDDINNFSPGCDAILDGRAFEKLSACFAFAKDAVKVIHKSFALSLLYNAVGLSFAVQGVMSPLFAAILMPISTVSIISFTSLMTRFYARRRNLYGVS